MKRPRTKLCHSCNKIIDRPISLTPGEFSFCNHKCYSEYKAKLFSGDSNPRWNGGEAKFNCKVCDKHCQRKKYGKKINKYCSIRCSAKDRGTYQRGKNHPMWKNLGGEKRSTNPIRRKAKYREWQKAVLVRDKYTCRDCGEKRKLETHHIKPLIKMVEAYKSKYGKINPDDDYFYRIKNGKTLCQICHRKTFNEKREELLEHLLK